ncbi:hypothetical protein [Streptomyces sp. NPDC004435]|uniref:hypothetical protein n=1 Tax=Streptomyces sp. NPDC004435 TaxID=3364701 RepID=UPI00367DECF4
MTRLLACLARDVVAEGVGDDLVATLDEILVTGGEPPAPSRGGLLSRLPYRWRRVHKSGASFSEGDAARLLFELQRSTNSFIALARQRILPEPTGLFDQLRGFHDGKAEPGDLAGYLRRYALAFVELLDLLGDDE